MRGQPGRHYPAVRGALVTPASRGGHALTGDVGGTFTPAYENLYTNIPLTSSRANGPQLRHA